MFDLAQAAVEGALVAGARYADARAVIARYETMSARNGDVQGLLQRESVGVGVRALVDSSWGFYAVPDPTGLSARQAGRMAADLAREWGLPGPSLDLAEVPVRQDSWESKCGEDPMSVSLAEKGDLISGVTGTMHAEGVPRADASYQIWDTHSWLVSSAMHRIDQHIRACGAGMSATGIDERESEIQRRSYPAAGGQYSTRGWEQIRELDLPGNAARVAEEAQALLTALECPAGETDLILGSEQMAVQVHETVGHAVELDRILGWEAPFTGTSWLSLDRLGLLRLGSELMTVTADATLPGAFGSFGYDDEGTPAQKVEIVHEGLWLGGLSGRDSAAIAGVPCGGMMRSDDYAHSPIVRMTNVGLRPGPHSLEEMIADTRAGVFMDSHRSGSVDNRRLAFQFGCEVGWEIKNGNRERMLRNPGYAATSPRLWRSMDMLGGTDEVACWGTPDCRKGRAGQAGHSGHPAAPARFRGVDVGGWR